MKSYDSYNLIYSFIFLVLDNLQPHAGCQLPPSEQPRLIALKVSPKSPATMRMSFLNSWLIGRHRFPQEEGMTVVDFKQNQRTPSPEETSGCYSGVQLQAILMFTTNVDVV